MDQALMGEVTIKIDAALSQRLERISAEAGILLQEIAISAILDRIEELDDAPPARQRWSEFQSGAAGAVAHDDLIRDLGIQ
jgi:hypothetical protein